MPIRPRPRPGSTTLKACPERHRPLPPRRRRERTSRRWRPTRTTGVARPRSRRWSGSTSRTARPGSTRFLAGQADAIDRVPPEHLPIDPGKRPSWPSSRSTGFENVNLWMRQDAPPPWDPTRQAARGGRLVDRPRGAGHQSRRRRQRGRGHPHPEPGGVCRAAGAGLHLRPGAGASGAGRSRASPTAAPEMPLWGVTGFLPRGEEVAEAIADSLQQVGFQVQLQVTDIAAHHRRALQPGQAGRLLPPQLEQQRRSARRPGHALPVAGRLGRHRRPDDRRPDRPGSGHHRPRGARPRSTPSCRPTSGRTCPTSRSTTATSPSPTARVLDISVLAELRHDFKKATLEP